MNEMPSKRELSKETAVVTLDHLERRIFDIRGMKVMPDSELATLYGVTTFRLNEAVKRNKARFPDDFMFQLNKSEHEVLTSQIAMSKKGRGGRRTLPYVFTEQGVAMLSSVLNSERAVQVNIAIMRAFVNMRRLAVTNEEVAKRLAAIERKIADHDETFKKVFGAIRAMLNTPSISPKQIGYIQKKTK